VEGNGETFQSKQSVLVDIGHMPCSEMLTLRCGHEVGKGAQNSPYSVQDALPETTFQHKWYHSALCDETEAPVMLI
jgi:hypothetical protein